jgi:hypothetical protein
LQVSCVSQLPLQQSQDALQDVVMSLHTSPSGLQPIGLRHTPTTLGGVMSHVTGLLGPFGIPAEPQQSLSCAQMSPTTWQPLAGWQTSTFVGPYGAHRRLQHAPPQLGSPASLTTVPPSGAIPPHTVPSTALQFAGPAGACPQVPRETPESPAMVQMPPQQSEPVWQTSPVWPQNEETAQTPPWQSAEQQSELLPHALPSVRQPPGSSDAHLPVVHVPLQH